MLAGAPLRAQPPRARRLDGASPRPAPSRVSRLVAAGFSIVWALVGACTLVSDDYDPSRVVSGALSPDAGEASPLCGLGAECCSSVPCASGERCVDGACESAVVGGENNGGDDNGGADAGLGPDGPVECVGSDCPGGVVPVPLAPSCDDGEQNGDETGTDCGGSCTRTCSGGAGCGDDGDCGEGLFCAADARCTPASCGDGLRNGDESDIDCGGICPGCPDSSPCGAGADCASGVCGPGGTCSAPTCNDAQRNGDEPDVDCGGSCPLDCGNGQACEEGSDCQSDVCGAQGCGAGVARCCQAPSCDDGETNGGESDVDCGTAQCGLCAVGDSCFFGFQCVTNSCVFGVCVAVPSCTDGIQNGTETGTDCGGSCGRCPDLSPCNQPADCINNNCDARGICISCGDAVRNGSETGIDCGGADPFCRRCNPGEACGSNTDCVNQFCLGGFCT